MTVQVMLISPALNAASREARFEGDAPLDEAGLRMAGDAAGAVPGADRYVRGPSERCRQTSQALGLSARTEPALRDWHMGRWSGQPLSDVSASEPEAVSAWLTDPSAAPHGGESLLDLTARVGSWLETLAGDRDGRVMAVVEPAVVRAAVVQALVLPVQAFWRLDVAPLALTELTGRSGRWNLRCGRPPEKRGAGRSR
ncbi:histidine phosphatase family protein [Streptomyces sp. NPDC060035]|uniref:histidine phosphatase family protein n=1 Tax=Streptomyces sp. NPDC060035 TaxID=3347044 RepID=UPI00368DD225